MTRVDELQKKYPTVPREVIVKWDALNQGIRHSADLDKVHEWTRTLPTYQSYDHDVSLKQAVDETANDQRPGFVKRPPEQFYMKNGVGVQIQRDAHSPYEIRELSPGRFTLCEGDEKVEDIYFLRPKRLAQEPVTSKGTPTSTLVRTKRVCFCVAPVRHCEYFALGEQCKFCNYNSTQEDARSLGLDRRVTVDLDDTVEAYRIISSGVPLVEGVFEMGGFRNSEQEAKIHAGLVEKIASGASYKPNLRVATQPMGRKDMQRLRDAGLDVIGYQMEVWDRRLFAEICPGKAKYTGYERYKEAYLEAVEVFGIGNVKAVFVGDVTLMPSNGHKSWQDSRDSLIDGLYWMIRHGVFPIFLSLRLGPGSIYGQETSNRDKLPPTEYYLDAAVAHHKASTEYGLYDRLNKYLACPMDGLEVVYGGELGIIERAGNYGNWLADVMPDQSNWLAHFVSTVSSVG